MIADAGASEHVVKLARETRQHLFAIKCADLTDDRDRAVSTVNARLSPIRVDNPHQSRSRAEVVREFLKDLTRPIVRRKHFDREVRGKSRESEW